MEHETHKHSRSWSHSDRYVHPKSPAGGGGPGGFRRAGPNLKLTAPPHFSGKQGALLHRGPADSESWNDTLLDVGLHLPGVGKSYLLLALCRIKKMRQTFAMALFRHYLEGSGESCNLNEVGAIPENWQTWIVKATTGKRLRQSLPLNPYNAKPPIRDLKNALGHFEVVVTPKEGSGAKIYDIEKKSYYFAFKPHDTGRTGQHGLELESMGDDDIRQLKTWLPTRQYQNPGGFSEGFEISRVHGVWTLFIPYQVLVEAGKPFRVYGRFER